MQKRFHPENLRIVEKPSGYDTQHAVVSNGNKSWHGIQSHRIHKNSPKTMEDLLEDAKKELMSYVDVSNVFYMNPETLEWKETTTHKHK